MNDPQLYRKTMTSKHMDRFDFLKECSRIIRWLPNGMDSLLDIGCGDGSFTSEFVQPILPKTFSRLVGMDINDEMVNYASKHFGKPNILFDIADIGSDITDFLQKYGKFDHITSFLCLHLVPDQKKAMENIFRLLEPNGDCLLYIIAEWPGQEIHKTMFTNWSEYMEDVDDFISHYSQRANPTYMLRKYLNNAGFSECNVTVREVKTVYNDLKEYERFYQSVSPFYNRMPRNRRDEFMSEFIKLSVEKYPPENDEFSEQLKLRLHYTFLAAYARK